MHASQLNHGILYMQVKKGTMTTLVKLTVVLEVSSLAVCRMCVFGWWGGHGWEVCVPVWVGSASRWQGWAGSGRQWQQRQVFPEACTSHDRNGGSLAVAVVAACIYIGALQVRRLLRQQHLTLKPWQQQQQPPSVPAPP